MFSWLGRWWRRRQRAIDIDILWSTCKEQAGTLDRARAAFLLHAAIDDAWTKDMTHEEIVDFVGRLS